MPSQGQNDPEDGTGKSGASQSRVWTKKKRKRLSRITPAPRSTTSLNPASPTFIPGGLHHPPPQKQKDQVIFPQNGDVAPENLAARHGKLKEVSWISNQLRGARSSRYRSLWRLNRELRPLLLPPRARETPQAQVNLRAISRGVQTTRPRLHRIPRKCFTPRPNIQTEPPTKLETLTKREFAYLHRHPVTRPTRKLHAEKRNSHTALSPRISMNC